MRPCSPCHPDCFDGGSAQSAVVESSEMDVTVENDLPTDSDTND
jgi:hypothetical protein